MGHVSQLAHPGSYIASRHLSRPYVVCRDEAGAIRGHYNVCQHHAMAVCAEGEGRLPGRFTCPYHGWEYGLDGRLRKATRIKGMQDFKASAVSLPPIHVHTVGPFIFANLPLSSPRTTAAPSTTTLPPSREPLQALQRVLAPTGYERLQWVRRVSYDLQCNWKVFCDNYLDGGYHVQFAHPALASALQMQSYRTEVLSPLLSVQTAGAAEEGRVTGDAVYAYLYPTLMVNRYGRWMDTNVVVPLSQRECRVVIDYWAEEGMGEEEREEGIRGSHTVQIEDVALCEGVQLGLESGVYISGRYAPSVEHAMHAMHVTYYDHLTKSAAEHSGTLDGGNT